MIQLEPNDRPTFKELWKDFWALSHQEKVLVIAVIICIPFTLYSVNEVIKTRSDLLSKIKFFNPTITEGFWGKRIRWEMREKPLTDEQLSEFTNQTLYDKLNNT